MAIYYNVGKVLAELELWLYDCVIENRLKNKVKEEVIDKIDELKKKYVEPKEVLKGGKL